MDLWRVWRRFCGRLGGPWGSIFGARTGGERVLLSASYQIALSDRFGAGSKWILGGFSVGFQRFGTSKMLFSHGRGVSEPSYIQIITKVHRYCFFFGGFSACFRSLSRASRPCRERFFWRLFREFFCMFFGGPFSIDFVGVSGGFRRRF